MIIQGVNEQRVVDFVTQKYRDLKDARREKERIWIDCLRAYMSDFDPIWDDKAKHHRRSKRFVALSFDAVESLEAQLLSAIIIGDNWLHFEPGMAGKQPYDDTAAKEVKALILSQLEAIDFKRDFGILLKQLLIYGNAPYTVGWQKQYATDYPAYSAAMERWKATYGERYRAYQQALMAWQMQVRDAQMAGAEPPARPSVVLPEPPHADSDVAYAGPSFEVGDIFNFVIDPFSPDRRNALRIKRSFVCKNVLRRLSEKNKDGYSVYDNIDEIEEVDRRGAQEDDFDETRFTAFGLQMPEADQVEILEAWGTMDIPGDVGGEKDAYVAYCATVANGTHLIRFEPTFLWSGECPVQLATFRDVPGHVYGVGQLEMALGLQDIINVRANQVIDATAFAIDPEYKARDDSIIDLNQKSRPGGVRLVGDPVGNLIPLVKDLTGIQLAMSEIESLKSEFQNIAKSQSPIAASRKESATRSSLSAGAINTDIAKVAAHIEETGLRKIISLFVQLNAQYKNKAEAVKFLQKGQVTFLDVSPESLRKHWVVKVRGSQHVIDKQERIQNLMMFMQMALGNPLIVPAVKPLELAKKVYAEFGFNDEDTIFRDEQQAEMVFQEMISLGLLGKGGQGADWRSGETDSRAAATGAGYSGGSGTGPGGQNPTGVPAAGEEDPARASGLAQ